MASFRPRPFVAALVAFAILVALVALNRWLFRVAFGTDYLLWYLKSGVVISLASGFLASVWDDAEARFNLISQNPAAFVAGCLRLLGVFVFSLSPTRRGRKARPAAAAGLNIGLDSPLAAALDEFFYGVLALVMLLLCLVWLAAAAPLTYFVNLVAGVPARQALRGRLSATHVREQGGQVELLETDAEIDAHTAALPPERAAGLSFARDPVAATQATAAVILWLGNLAYERLG